MKPDDPVIAISAIEHFVYCPRQCALIGVWTDNVHTVQLPSPPPGRQRATSSGARPDGTPGNPPVVRGPGLSGRADAVEIQSGVVRPVEYKSGTRHGLAADLQLCAQALCLEEMLDVAIPDGHIWYSGPRRRIRVEFTAALRTEVRHAVDQIRLQILSGALPEAPNDQRCAACQLQHHCLPGITSEVQRVSSYVRNVVFECAT